MATKKQITDAMARIDTIEDNMVNQDKQISLLREMITMQNKSIEFLTQLLNKHQQERESPPPRVEAKEELPSETLVSKHVSRQGPSRFGRRAV